MDFEKAQITYRNLRGKDQITQVILELAQTKKIDKKRYNHLKKLFGDLKKIAERRNEYFHRIWLKEGSTGDVILLKPFGSKAKKKPYSFYKFDINELKALNADIKELYNNFSLHHIYEFDKSSGHPVDRFIYPWNE